MSEVSENLPPIGGPMNEAIPWNKRSRPKAFVKLSNPNKSTKITDVSPEKIVRVQETVRHSIIERNLPT